MGAARSRAVCIESSPPIAKDAKPWTTDHVFRSAARRSIEIYLSCLAASPIPPVKLFTPPVSES
jgi:hypothetical protein